MISIIVAMSPNHAIGYKGGLPWHIPEDMAHFKQLTMGHTIVMGRKTYDSLPHGALPCRRNVVISRTKKSIPGCDVYPSLGSFISLFGKSLLSNDALNSGQPLSSEQPASSDEQSSELFVIGGASIYAAALPFADKLYITLVDKDPANADTFFPALDLSKWWVTKKEKHDGFSFLEFVATPPTL